MSAIPRPSSSYEVVKRTLDVLASGALLVVLSPLMLLVAATVAMALGRPVVFRQSRPGRDGAVFELLKFRSMRELDPTRGLITDAERLTPFGRLLRSSSLDELPSLVNVLRGQMSMVGPRPLLVAYLDRYTTAEARRHDVRPGLTGLAQVQGRNVLAWDARLRADVDYVEQRSLGLDARIVLSTLLVVARRRGVSAEGQATMSEFRPPAPPRTGPARSLVVIGAGGFGRETLTVLDALAEAGRPVADTISVVDDAPRPRDLDALRRRGITYAGTVDEWLADGDDECLFVVGIGTPAVRESIARRVLTAGRRPCTVVHPTASIGSDVEIGVGSVLCPGVVVSTGTRLGRFVTLNPRSVIGHDTQVQDWSSVNPAAVLSGDVVVESGALIGAGAVVLQGLTVGTGALVGASACVTRDVAPATVVKGVPAR